MNKDLLATLAVTMTGPTVTLVAPVLKPHERSLAELQWKQLIDDAHGRLGASLEPGEIDHALAGAAELLDGTWPTHERSVVYVGSPDNNATYALPVTTDPAVVVTDGPAVALLAGLIGPDPFAVLALGLRGTRLFDGDGAGLHDHPAPDLPTGFDDVIAPPEPGEPSGEHRAGTHGVRGGAKMHHGADDAGVEHRRELDLFCRRVDGELWHALGLDDHRPVVVAGASDLVARFRALSAHPDRIVATVDGSIERTSSSALHARVIDALGPHRRQQIRELVDRFEALRGSGRASDDPDEVATAVSAGRVEVLLIPHGAALDAAVNATATDTVRHRGRVVSLADDELLRPAAILRW